IGSAAVLGWRRQQRRWLFTAGAMLLVVLHDWPLLWISFARIPLLWPWYSLQLALVAWFFLWAEWKSQKKQTEPTEDPSNTSLHALAIVAPLLSGAWQISAGLSVIEWLLHAFSLFIGLAAGGTQQ